jgi:hypothetical protein
MMTPGDEAVNYTIHGWYMPDGKAAANKRCIVEGCDEWAAHHLCNQHAIPGMVVEAKPGNTFVISTWLVPFSFLVLISVFLEEIPRQDALEATIPISLDL